MNLSNSILLVIAFTFSNSSFSAEYGQTRGLQIGPVGDGFGLYKVNSHEVEANVTFGRSIGEEKNNVDVLSSSANSTKFKAASSFLINPNFNFRVLANAENRTYEASGRGKGNIVHRGDQAQSEIGAGPTLHRGNWSIGGYASVLMHGDESRNYSANSLESDIYIKPSVMPLLTAYSSWSSKKLSLLAGFRLFNSAKARATVSDTLVGEAEFDIRRRNPAKIWLDLSSSITPRLTVSYGLAYLTTGQASPDASEFQIKRSAGRLVTQQDVSGRKVNENHFEVDLGGAYKAEEWIHFFSAIHYIEPFFSEHEFASLESENLGGYRMDVGLALRPEMASLLFDVGYQMPNPTSYTKTVATSNSWTEVGDNVETEQAIWEVQVGASTFF